MRVKNKKSDATPVMVEQSSRNEGTGLGTTTIKSKMFDAEDFLSANEKISILSLDLLKSLYDLTKSCENKTSLEDPLGLQTESLKNSISKPIKKKKKKRPQTLSKAEAPVVTLITEDFDEDQIWEEVELQNGFMYDNLVTSVSKLLAFQEKPLEQGISGGIDTSSEEEEENEVMSHHGTQSRLPGLVKDTEEDAEDSDFFESDEKYRKRAIKGTNDGKKYPKSVVDDQFFSLAQMTEHIEQVEAEMEKAETIRPGESQKDDDADLSDEDSIDLFEEIPSDDDQSEKQEAQYFYQDFFDPPQESEAGKLNISDKSQMRSIINDEDGEYDLDDDDDEEPSAEQVKSVRFNLDKNRDADEEDEDESESEKEDDDDVSTKQVPGQSNELGKKINNTLSTFEKRKKKIEENIQEIENAALQPKSWQLLGEATGESRPENALLEEHLVYDHMIRPAPEITIETTKLLEDVIMQRIKDGAFDDVIRKVRPIEDPREYKKRLVLDSEKSKASLAEIYEQEYLDKKKTEDGVSEEKEPEDQLQIRKEMHNLFQKLDALSHFHFTPKAPKADVKIVSNVPSLSVEETAGVSISDANMLAPQEIQDHAMGAIKGKDERSITDRKRERRKKKKKQHLKRLMEEEKAKAKGLGLRNIKLAEGIVKSRRNETDPDGSGDFSYSTSNQSSKELKSSRAFFSKLQESASSHIDKVAKRKKFSTDGNVSAKKFKL